MTIKEKATAEIVKNKLQGKYVGWVKYCPNCKCDVQTTCSICGCGSCTMCGYIWVCNPSSLFGK